MHRILDPLEMVFQHAWETGELHLCVGSVRTVQGFRAKTSFKVKGKVATYVTRISNGTEILRIQWREKEKAEGLRHELLKPTFAG